MAKIILPDRIFGRSIDGAMERVLNRDKTQADVPEQTTPQANAPNLNGYIYVPSINFYVAKERDLNGQTWNQAIEKIYNQGINVAGQRAEMPTPFEFMSGLIYVLDNQNIPNLTAEERAEFLEDILKKGDYKGNHLNARVGDNVIETATIENGKLKWVSEPLKPCLGKDCYADIRKINSQGLFTTEATNQSYVQGETAYFLEPGLGAVARFDACFDGACLHCSGDADLSFPSLGVRFVVRQKGRARKSKEILR